jgi:hypothetical protein
MNTIAFMLTAHSLEQHLKSQLPSYAVRDFEEVLAGRNSVGIMGSAPNEFRGIIAVWIYYRCLAGECDAAFYRDALSAAWEHDHEMILAAVSNRRMLRRMFRWAEFPIPEHSQTNIDIWRGTRGALLHRARQGISWTADRDVACWFAMRHPHPERKPLVLKATIPKIELLDPLNGRDEYEVICFNAATANVDGDPEEWRLAYQRREDAKNTAQRLALSRAVARLSK